VLYCRNPAKTFKECYHVDIGKCRNKLFKEKEYITPLRQIVMNWKKHHIREICLIGLALIISVFLVADFAVGEGKYTARAEVETFSFGTPEMYVDELYFSVEGNNARLEEELRARLQKEGITLRESVALKEPYDSDVLLVAVIEEERTYTPLYSKITTEILFFYSSSGKTKYFTEFRSGESPVVNFSSDEGDQFIIKGIITLIDSTTGLMSPKGYRSHTAEKMAQEIVTRFIGELDSTRRS
jgi:hypothetical protein